MIFIGLSLPIIGFWIAKKNDEKMEKIQQIKDQLIVFLVGVLFALGLMVSGMSRR